MKNKYILIIFILGVIGAIIGSLFKIMHWPSANILLTLGMGMQVIAGLVAIWKIAINKNSKSFLNH
ncbi:gliding motility protein GldL [Mesonia sp. K7]|uniref:GldL-related protein n=1 Tax=Mesonia sp. K7 TaxID=2218606 RepID=UPI000DAA4D2A|nr:gliding motility protein GldL [Mesonia sp. K7]PZD79522.1 gliding motility protein GldL [Mesonia sp. K7]